MTQEQQKAKAYDDVVNKLRHFIAQGVDPLITRADVQDFFPELAESEDERIRKEFYKDIWNYVPCEKAHKYITWLKKQGEKLEIQKESDLPKGEDYGIDSLWHAQRILEKTLGKVDGYQSDDGILEHECAISAIKELYKRKPYWSEEDEKMYRGLHNLIYAIQYCDSRKEFSDWLKSLKDRIGE